MSCSILYTHTKTHIIIQPIKCNVGNCPIRDPIEHDIDPIAAHVYLLIIWPLRKFDYCTLQHHSISIILLYRINHAHLLFRFCAALILCTRVVITLYSIVTLKFSPLQEPFVAVYKLPNYITAKRVWKLAVEHHAFFRWVIILLAFQMKLLI